MATIDQLAAQEQLHFQVISQRIDNLYTNLNSSNNAQTAVIRQAINDSVNNVGGQLYAQSNRVITALTGRVNAIEQETLNTVRNLFQAQIGKIDTTKQEIQAKLDVVLARTLADIDKQQSIITANLKNATDSMYLATKQYANQTQELITAIEGNIKSSISNAITVDNKNTKELLNLINSNVQTSATNTANNLSTLNNTLKQSGIFSGSGEPAWLTDLMAQIYASGSNNSGSGGDNLFTSLIRIISGDAAANTFNAINSSNVVEEILAQAQKIGQIESDFVNGKYTTLDDFNNALKNAGIGSTILGGAFQLLFIIANIGDMIKSFGLPTKVKIEQFNIAAYSLKQLSEADIVGAFIRNLITYDTAIKELDNLGHSKHDSELILKTNYPKFNVNELLKLAHLGKIDPKTLQTRLRELGWNDIDAVLQGYINQPRPGINDLIQFAVKEVYSPETYNKFGQYLEFPQEFADRAKLEGLDETFAKQYWAAHWQLPSATMGYDMLHRGIINTTELKALLKALDVMPFWREKLVQLSYNVVGRIDTRRLYAYGIWDRQKVYEEYLHEGYSPKDAEDLTKFTVMYDSEQDSKHKTKLQTQAHNVYIKAYNYKLASKETTKQRLIELGYKSQDIDLELSLEDYELYVDKRKPKYIDHAAKIVSLSLDGYRRKALSRSDLLDTLTKNGYSLVEANLEADLTDKEAAIAFKSSVIKEIQKLYFESLYDDNAVLTKLMQLGFANSESLHMIGELQILKNLDDKKPTQAQFEKMYKAGILSRVEYANILAEEGYNNKYIESLILLAESG